MDFNPFHKPLNQVETKDLVCLTEVYECWYVDYKREKVKIRDIAKHLCAFANRFGGYLFFGIDESQDGRAGSFCGVKNEEIEQLIVDIREAAHEHISPHAAYKVYTYHGPCAEISLPEDSSVVLVHIDQSYNPPHVHSSGKIYIRADNQSKVLTDRHELNLLMSRGKDIKKDFAEFVHRRPQVPGAQKDTIWIFTHIVCEAEPSIGGKRLSFQDFLKYTKNLPQNFTPSIPMDSVSGAWDGYFARHIHSNKPTLATPAMRWWHNGDIRFEFPINAYTVNEFNLIRKYKFTGAFIDELNNKNYTDAIICDFSVIFMGLAALFNMYLHMLDCVCVPKDLFATFQIINMHYKIPFGDFEGYIERCKNYGFPIIQEEDVVYAKQPFYDNMIKMPMKGPFEKEFLPFICAGALASHIFLSIGIVTDPHELNFEEMYKIT